MAFELPKISYSGKILEVAVGQSGNTATVGGESAYPFHGWEGAMPNKPLVAMEIWDSEPEDWPAACSEPFKDVLGDPAGWAKKCQDEYGAEAIVLQLKSTDPNGADASPEAASAVVGKVLGAISVPLVIWGSANAKKDAEVLKQIAEDHQNQNLLLGPVDEDNHKAVGAAALGFGHQIIASSPIDVNLAKQLNILLGNLGVPMEKLVIDPTTGGLGYGMEYGYSVMERIRAAALVQEDDKLVLPMINNIGNEVWKSKEAKQSDEDAPELGDASKRGYLMEATAAVALAMAGSDILILRHPETVGLIKGFLNKLLAEPAERKAAAKADRPKVAALAGAKPAAKPAAAPAKPAAAAPKPAAAAPKPAAAAPKPAAPAAAAPAPEPAPAAPAAPAVDPEKAAAQAAAQAAAAAEAKKKAAAEAAAKAAAEAKAKVIAEENARRERVAKQMEAVQELRAKRREERMKHIEEAEKKKAERHAKELGVDFGEDRKPGIAGQDGDYILRTLTRWSLRGDGYLKK